MIDGSATGTQRVRPNQLRAIWQMLKLTFAEWTNDNAFQLSAALAFYTVFSIAPLLLIVVGVPVFSLRRKQQRTGSSMKWKKWSGRRERMLCSR